MAGDEARLSALTEFEYEYQLLGFGRKEFVACIGEMIAEQIKDIKENARIDLLAALGSSEKKKQIIETKLAQLETFFLNNATDPVKRICAFANEELSLPRAALPEDETVPTSTQTELQDLKEEIRIARDRAILASLRASFYKRQLAEAKAVSASKYVQVAELAADCLLSTPPPPAATLLDRRISIFNYK